MTSKLTVLQKLIPDPKKLFLIDSLGAFLTAFLLITVPARFEAAFGMPVKTLYALSAVALIYAFYSGCCYLTVKNWKPYLTAIAIANLTYCIIIIGLLIFYSPRLTALGMTYFAAELVVISVLVFVELTTVFDR